MSQRLIARSPDLTRLQKEGYDVGTRGGTLLLRDIPYLTQSGEVKRGTLVSTMELADDVTVNPVRDHVAFFSGEKPFAGIGVPLPHVINEGLQQEYGGVRVSIQLSSKPIAPAQQYRDYHHKMSTYARVLTQGALTVDPTATAIAANRVIVEDEEDTVFKYADSASSRAGLDSLSARLRVGKVAIVGIGGTGSYILDLLAKTEIAEIHLFDGDDFQQHNAFRAPGAPTSDELATRPKKVEWFGSSYSRMRRGIIQHPVNVDESNAHLLQDMSFAFVAIDNGASRQLVVERLETFGIPFIDVGIGVKERGGVLTGLIRTTTSTNENREFRAKLPFGGAGGEDDYTRNIQVAELNALSAALAVVRWKKFVGFYGNLDGELHSLYAINANYLINT